MVAKAGKRNSSRMTEAHAGVHNGKGQHMELFHLSNAIHPWRIRIPNAKLGKRKCSTLSATSVLRRIRHFSLPFPSLLSLCLCPNHTQPSRSAQPGSTYLPFLPLDEFHRSSESRTKSSFGISILGAGGSSSMGPLTAAGIFFTSLWRSAAATGAGGGGP